jgi:IS605 OrfB family transposase
VISYNTRLVGSQEDLQSLLKILEWERLAFNEASKIQFNEPKKSIVILHSKFYYKLRKSQPQIPSQVLIRGEQSCLSAYRSVKSNKHKIAKPIEKKRLSMRLDKRLYSQDKTDKYAIKITTADKRKKFKFVVYPKLKELFDKFPYCDPLIYVDSNKNICICFSFENNPEKLKQKLCLGVDLGVRIIAACSDGRLIRDKSFNARKRKLRHLKSRLKSKGSKSARKHLNKIRHKEHNVNKNQSHLVANEILKTNADTIALENLKGIKAKKHHAQNKNRISQIPLAELRRIITYKAENTGKTVILVNPYMTSQTDCLTGKLDGERKGRRFYAKSGLVYDSDLNAARNIGIRSKLPVSQGNLLDGQGIVNCPIVCKSSSQESVLQASMALA